MKNLTRTLALIGHLALASLSLNAAAAVVIDFATGGVPGGSINYDGTNAIGTGIGIGTLLVQGTTSADGNYVVTNGLLNFNTELDNVTITGSIGALGVEQQTLLTGQFNTWSVQGYPGPTEVFSADGPDVKSVDLLNAISVNPSTPFNYFGFSIEAANGTVVSTDIVNTAVPVPAAVWLFGSGLLGMVGIARRRRS